MFVHLYNLTPEPLELTEKESGSTLRADTRALAASEVQHAKVAAEGDQISGTLGHDSEYHFELRSKATTTQFSVKALPSEYELVDPFSYASPFLVYYKFTSTEAGGRDEGAESAPKISVSVVVLRRSQPHRWMSDIADDVNLSDLYLPGTHESLALHGFPISNCQAKRQPIGRQLEGGIRFVDLRYRLTEDNVLRAYHGIQNEYMTFEESMNYIYAFLDANPTETVVASIKQENAAPNFEQKVLDFIDARRDKWHTDSSRWPNLGEVRGKIVLYCRFGFSSRSGLHPETWPDNSKVPFVCPTSGQDVIVQDWYNIGSIMAVPEKAALATSLFDVPYGIPGKTKEDNLDAVPFRINFLSGATFITAFPFLVAQGFGWPRIGLGFDGVNARVLYALLDRLSNGLRLSQSPQEVKSAFDRSSVRLVTPRDSDKGMALLMDYWHQPSEALSQIIIALNKR